MIFKDLVIVLPGISGSVLSKDGNEVWGASTIAPDDVRLAISDVTTAAPAVGAVGG
jgi:hypothetical protein